MNNPIVPQMDTNGIKVQLEIRMHSFIINSKTVIQWFVTVFKLDHRNNSMQCAHFIFNMSTSIFATQNFCFRMCARVCFFSLFCCFFSLFCCLSSLFGLYFRFYEWMFFFDCVCVECKHLCLNKIQLNSLLVTVICKC